MTRRNAGEGNVRQRPNGGWEGRYVDSIGKRRSVYGRTKREVTDALLDAIGKTAQGIVVPSKTLTVGDYMAEWLRDHAAPTVRPTTLASYRHMTDRYIVPELGRVSLAKLQPAHVAAMLRKAPERAGRGPISPTTVRYAYSVLRIALGRALKLGYVTRNVATLIDPPSKAPRELRPLTAEQVRHLLDTSKDDRLHALYLAAVATGLRQGELLAIRWQDVDLEAGLLAVRHTLARGTRTLAETKTDRGRRIIPLPRRVVESLLAHRRRQKVERIAAGPRWQDLGYVFATPIGTAQDPRNALRRFHAALEAAELARQPFHALRHAYATLQLGAGEQLANVSKLLGHANLSTTADLYAHLAPPTERRAADTMDRLLAV